MVSKKWINDNVISEKYLNSILNSYSSKNYEQLLLLNIDLRMLYLKYILMIENNLKHIILKKIKTIENTSDFHKIVKSIWKSEKLGNKLIRNGYNKYYRSHILKHKSLKNLVKVMSFEWTMKFLENFNNETLKQIANYFEFPIEENYIFLFNELNYLKDMRNYFSHNFKVINIDLKPKNKDLLNIYYQHSKEEKKLFLNSIIAKYSKKIIILEDFNSEFKKLLDKYNIEEY